MDKGSIRTFNPAKKFAEEILHPLMAAHKDAKIRSRLGAISDDEATKLRPEVRVIKRFNAMKERIIYQQTLLNEIESTVRLNGRKSEFKLINELSRQLSILEDSYDDRSSELMIKSSGKLNNTSELTPLFKKMGQYLDKIYVQLQLIMTKNKLLFSGEDNEFLKDEDLMEKIKNENRNA